MIVYNDIFTWEKKSGDETLWLSSCQLWVIDRSKSEKISLLKPFIVVASDQSPGPGRRICAETIGRQIFKEFDIDIRRTLWVEYDPDTLQKLMVAQFTPKYHDGIETIFSINWRRLHKNEIGILKKYLPAIFCKNGQCHR